MQRLRIGLRVSNLFVTLTYYEKAITNLSGHVV